MRHSPQIGVAVLALGIFIFDTFTQLEIAAASLYVAVVLLSARLYGRRELLAIAGGCMVLTLMSYVLTPAGTKEAGLINTGISLAVIALSTFLILESESAKQKALILSRAEQLREALIGSVSHELKTPLTSIMGGVSVLAETQTVKSDGELSNLVAGIGNEAARLNGDIQNLLDAARIAGDDLQSRIDWTDPEDVIRAAVQRALARNPGRKIDVRLAGTLPLVRIDPVLVDQAVYQIIANALKFSPPVSGVAVSAERTGNDLVISVQDEGIGLAPDEKDKVVERFFRSERHVGKIPGSGLGMWIANTFIATSGGALEVASEGEGRGTTVRIVFPIPEQGHAAPPV
jgi:two-component system, OmpR family, sensor histidine kinase KdpD